MQYMIRHAYKVSPYVKSQLDSVGLKPSDVSSVESLKRIPLSNRTLQYRELHHFGITALYPLNLQRTRGYFGFHDDGTAFVNALEKRPSLFGSLDLIWYEKEPVLNRANLGRLLKLKKFTVVIINKRFCD